MLNDKDKLSQDNFRRLAGVYVEADDTNESGYSASVRIDVRPSLNIDEVLSTGAMSSYMDKARIQQFVEAFAKKVNGIAKEIIAGGQVEQALALKQLASDLITRIDVEYRINQSASVESALLGTTIQFDGKRFRIPQYKVRSWDDPKNLLQSPQTIQESIDDLMDETIKETFPHITAELKTKHAEKVAEQTKQR